MIFFISKVKKEGNIELKMKKKFNNFNTCGNLLNNQKIVFSLKKSSKNTDYSNETTSLLKLRDNNVIETENIFKLNTISHNLTISYTNDKKMFGIGGVLTNHKFTNYGEYNEGIYLIKFKEDFNIDSISLLIKKELSLKQNYLTHFDTQASISYNPNEKKYFLYHRYNEAPSIRRCQVFISDYYDRDYKKGILVNFIGRNDIYVYSTYVYYQNNKFIGIFKYYTDIVKNARPKKRSLLKAISKDGINFKIINYNFLDLEDGLFICQNHEQTSDYNIYYFTDYMNKTFKKIYSPIKDDEICVDKDISKKDF